MAYATAAELAAFLRIDDTTDDVQLDALLVSASRVIDTWCDTTFDEAATTATARVFRAEWHDLIYVDPISSTTDLVVKTDTSGDGTFDQTWSASDYQLEPLNQRRAGLADHPYWAIRAIESRWFPVDRQARVQVTARWGWTSGVPAPVRDACILLAKDMHQQRNMLSGVAFGDGVAAYTRAMSPMAKMMLAPYRRVGRYGV